MCVARVVEVVAVDHDRSLAVVRDRQGRRHRVQLLGLDDGGRSCRPGSHLIAHSGLAIAQLTRKEADDRQRLMDGTGGSSDGHA